MTMDRVLVAYDGSRCADLAIALVRSRHWPPDTHVRVATVVPGTVELRGSWRHLALDEAARLEGGIMAEARTRLRPAIDRLSSRGLQVDSTVLTGRTPQELAAEADRFGASIVVVGSRGLGAIEATLLGSVSAEVADLAPCPVLVVRSRRLGRVVLATDGSPAALDAERYLVESPVVAGLPVTVVSVAEGLIPWSQALVPVNYGFVVAAHAEQEAAARRSHREIADAAVERLEQAGFEAAAVVTYGDPASEILAAADADGAGLVVLGSRGRTGLSRLVQGSVARRVLQRGRASVLVVRAGTAGAGAQPGDEEPPEER